MKRKHPIGLLQPLTHDFIVRWREKKHYPYSPYIDIADCLEILFATPAFHYDTSFEGSLVFDHLLDLKEIKIGYEGVELLDILIYYIQDYVKQRVVKASTMV